MRTLSPWCRIPSCTFGFSTVKVDMSQSVYAFLLFAMVNESAIPQPDSTYHAGSRCSMPADFHIDSSLLCVPDLSPREMNVAFASAIFLKASLTSFEPATFAGSSAGPSSTKVLYITWRRSRPKPSATKSSSAFGECTQTTSASPRFAIARASPVPTAMGFTSTLFFCLNIGRRTSRSPVSCTLVVVPRTIVSAFVVSPFFSVTGF
jgi:hypothetical protein